MANLKLSKYKHNKIVKTLVAMIRFLRFPGYLILKYDRNQFKIHAALESVQKIKSSHQTVVRFGDGEFNLMLDRRGISFQEYSEELANDLSLAFNDQNILVGIPYGFFDTKLYKWNIKSFWWSYVCRHREFLKSISGREFIDSTFSRTVTEVIDHSKSDQIINETMALWNNRNVLVIEGSQTKFGIGNNLLSNAKSVQRIIGPKKNAYSEIDNLYDTAIEAIDGIDNPIILVSLGPTATVLAHKLAGKTQAIDIGHFDLQYEYKRRGKHTSVNVPNKFDNERVDGDKTTNETQYSDEYNKQIIAKFVE